MPQSEEDANSQQKQSDTKQKSAKTFLSKWAKQKYEACKAYARRHYEKISNRPWWFKEKDPVAKFTGWVSIYTLLLAIVAGLQTCVLTNQLQEMKEENRPWVYVENAGLWSPLAVSETEAQIVLQFSLNNTGRFPAQSTTITGEFFFSRSGSDTPFITKPSDIQKLYYTVAACIDRRHNTIPGTTIFPQQRTWRNQIFRMDSVNVASGRQLNQKRLERCSSSDAWTISSPVAGFIIKQNLLMKLTNLAPIKLSFKFRLLLGKFQLAI